MVVFVLNYFQNNGTAFFSVIQGAQLDIWEAHDTPAI